MYMISRTFSRPVLSCSVIRAMSSVTSPRIPLYDTIKSVREWRQKARDEKKSVGFIATMGALHDGHLSLVRRSLAENDLTVLSIFVNPAQFAPHEDLGTYPRTLSRDLELLASQRVSVINASAPLIRTLDAVFLPSVQEIYPSGICQDISSQKGTFVEVKGYGHQMEGKSRPAFFRGVATVVTKLFNIIEPTSAYFGQKDIQQSLLLRRLCSDLLFFHPDPSHMHIVPTARDPTDELALSSRNAYLNLEERQVAGTLRAALKAGEKAWLDGLPMEDCLKRSVDVVDVSRVAAQSLGVEIILDYLEMNDSQTFDVLDSRADMRNHSDPVILSGAIWVGKTRLIDNIILGDSTQILS